MIDSVFKIDNLPSSRWKECRNLRLEALQAVPIAFGSSYEEEKVLSENEWRNRIGNAIFALENDIPIGMIVAINQSNKKGQHIANIFSAYVKKSHRGKGVGYQLITEAVARLREDNRIRKIKLTVNSKLDSAIKLYKKAGFTEVGVLKKELFHEGIYYDEIMMELYS